MTPEIKTALEEMLKEMQAFMDARFKLRMKQVERLCVDNGLDKRWQERIADESLDVDWIRMADEDEYKAMYKELEKKVKAIEHY